jgi:hypothetical protein
MVLPEVILTAVAVVLIVLGGVGWVTRPIWTNLWKQYQREEAAERRAAERAKERAEDHAEACKEAEAEVRSWHEDGPGETQENRTS